MSVAFIEIKWSDVDPGRELKALDKKIETFPWTFKEYYRIIIAWELTRDHPGCYDLSSLL